MTLADVLASPPSTLLKGPRCAVNVQHEQLDAADGAALVAAVCGHVWRATDLETALAAQGIRLPAEAIRRHRGRRCACKEIAPDLYPMP